MAQPIDLLTRVTARYRRLPAAQSVRRAIMLFLPPVVTGLAQTAVQQRGAKRYHGSGWDVDGLLDRGWNRASVAAAQEAHWPTLLRNLDGPGPLGVGHWPDRRTREDVDDHNVMMSYGYVLAYAARHKDRLSILDWGGGLGHYYLYSRALLPDVVFDYHCYDVPALCEVGRRLQPDVHFHQGADTLEGAEFDLVICSAALHFFERWRDVARMLCTRAKDLLYITRLAIVESGPSFVVRQRSSHYDTEFQSWCLNRGELFDCVQERGMALLREFLFMDTQALINAPEPSSCRGFLLHRAH
jgi:putative methyltransferase (TIGR04325 family)